MTNWTPNSIERIIETVKWKERQATPRGTKRLKRRGSGGGGGGSGGVCKSTTVISGFNDVTLEAGFGTIQPYRLNDSGILETNGDTITGYNMAHEIATDSWLQYKKDNQGNAWIDVELCPVETP